MSRNKHVEINGVLVTVVGSFAVLGAGLIFLLPVQPTDRLVWIPVIIVALIGALMARTRIAVNAESVTMQFTTPIPRRVVNVEDVRSWHIVRVPWWLGWGFRFWPGWRCWRGAGDSAIEFKMRGGFKLQIGCKDPDRVASLLRTHDSWQSREER